MHTAGSPGGLLKTQIAGPISRDSDPADLSGAQESTCSYFKNVLVGVELILSVVFISPLQQSDLVIHMCIYIYIYIFFFFFLIYLLVIFGCAGSLLLPRLFSSWGAQAPGYTGFSSYSSPALEHRLSHGGARA